MDKPKFTRHFNLSHAMAGAPISCANGTGAEILRYLDTKLIGVQTGCTGRQFAFEWNVDGTCCHPGHVNALDLVMLPLGVIDGKPVFIGDEFLWQLSGELTKATPEMAGGEWGACRWPVPEKVYPETQVCAGHMVTLYETVLNRADGGRHGAVHAIANAALRHAIDAGQVVAKEEHEAALHRLGESLRPVADNMRAKRDIDIAIAVKEAFAKVTFHCAPNFSNLQAYVRMLNLNDIIASVK